MLKEEVFWRTEHKPSYKITVPSQIVIHVTSSCPNNCRGCYSKKYVGELDLMLFEKVIREAEELSQGYTFFGISGGEPLSRTDIWDTVALHPTSHFIVYTSGTGFWQRVSQLEKLSNIFMFFSSKVNCQGKETGEDLRQILEYCRTSQLPFGISLLVTQENIRQTTSEIYLGPWTAMGARSFLFMCYHSLGEEDERFGHTLKLQEVQYLLQRVEVLQGLFGIPIMKGLTGHGVTNCRAGRKILSISPSGEIELCPFAPISLGNVRACSLKQALNAPVCKFVRLMNKVNKILCNPCINPCNLFWGGIVLEETKK